MSRAHVLAIALAVPACGGSNSSSPVAESQALSSAVDLISPHTCTLKGTHYVNCAIAAQSLDFTPFESAVPLRTTVTAQKSGNCSIQYSLSVSLKADSDAPQSFAYIAGGSTVLRHANGALI